MSLKKLGAAFVVVLSMIVVAPQAASASTITFTCLSNNTGACSSIDQFFTGEVTVSGTLLTVDIFNDGSNGVIGQAYADLPETGFSFNSVGGSVGTSYVGNVPGGNFPEGNTLVPTFDEDVDASATAPAPDNGALDGEFVRFVFNLLDGQTQGDIDDLLADNLIRFGLHVQSLEVGTGGSEALISQFVEVNQQCTDGTCPSVPEPTSMLLLGTGLLAVARTARRRKTS